MQHKADIHAARKAAQCKTMSEAVDMARRSLPRSAAAGFAYFAVVFAAGFVLGAVRVLALAPRLGESVAVLLELPVMLAVSWRSCRWVIARLEVPKASSARLVMGGLAFAMLMIAEMGISIFGFGRTLSDHLEYYRQMPVLLGLAGQIAFAAFPIVQGAASIRGNA